MHVEPGIVELLDPYRLLAHVDSINQVIVPTAAPPQHGWL